MSLAEVNRIALFSRLLSPRFYCFPSFSSLTSDQDLYDDPILHLLEVTWQSSNQGHECKTASKDNVRHKHYNWVHHELRTHQDDIHRTSLIPKIIKFLLKDVKNDFQQLFRCFGLWIWWNVKFCDNPLNCYSCVAIQYFRNIFPNFM